MCSTSSVISTETDKLLLPVVAQEETELSEFLKQCLQSRISLYAAEKTLLLDGPRLCVLGQLGVSC